jgi:hypothetical protein
MIPNGETQQVTFTPCGPDCAHYQAVGADGGYDLHLQRNTWVNSDGDDLKLTIDKDSLKMSVDTPSGRHMTDQLTKNG